MLHDLNKTYVCLIPKFNNANKIQNFRPISLCNTLYKVITKVIANCIKPFLKYLISDHQSSFVKNRRATNNAIIIQEVLKRFNSQAGKGNCILKLDLEKAFDKLEWSFVYRILKFHNFLLI